jgi:hypothetical protein
MEGLLFDLNDQCLFKRKLIVKPQIIAIVFDKLVLCAVRLMRTAKIKYSNEKAVNPVTKYLDN